MANRERIDGNAKPRRGRPKNDSNSRPRPTLRLVPPSVAPLAKPAPSLWSGAAPPSRPSRNCGSLAARRGRKAGSAGSGANGRASLRLCPLRSARPFRPGGARPLCACAPSVRARAPFSALRAARRPRLARFASLCRLFASAGLVRSSRRFWGVRAEVSRCHRCARGLPSMIFVRAREVMSWPAMARG